jgi:ribosomal protein S18 acetylase RimI-like enzyme
MTDAEYDTMRTPALEEFAADLARSAHAPVDDAIRARAAHFYPETLSEATAVEGAHINRVIDESGTDVGLLWLGRSPDNARTGFVYDVIIEEVHRGKGLGRAAMLAAEDQLRADGCTRIALNVWGWNRRAIALYDSLGYQVDSQQMSKSLTGEAEG